MNDKEFDIVLKNVLKPDILPGDELNQMLLDRVHGSTHTENKSSDTRKKSRNTVNYLLRAAAIALVVSCIGGIGVYAANYILKKTTVYEHGISVGNQEYNNDEALTEPAEEVTEIKEGTFKGGPDDKWVTKNVLITGGAYRNTYYDYSDYETAVDDIDFNSLFSESIGKAVSICYVETEEIEDKSKGKDYIYYKSFELDSTFDCNGKTVFVSQSKAEGIAENAAYSVIMNKTSNERSYTSKSGIEFTLVDDIEAKVGGTESGVSTFVMIAYGKYVNYIRFDNMTDDEIHDIMDKVIIPE